MGLIASVTVQLNDRRVVLSWFRRAVSDSTNSIEASDDIPLIIERTNNNKMHSKYAIMIETVEADIGGWIDSLAGVV